MAEYYITRQYPDDIATCTRIEHQRDRYLIMEGLHYDLVEKRQLERIGPTRMQLQGSPSLSSNLLATYCRKIATLYDNGVTVMNPAGGAGVMSQMLERAAYHSVMPDFQAMTIGLNDYFMSYHWAQPRGHAIEDGHWVLRPVAPHMTESESHPDDPGQPIIHREVVERRIGGNVRFTIDVWDVSDPNDPRFNTWLGTESSGQDITEEAWADLFDKIEQREGTRPDNLSGANYPGCWRMGERSTTPGLPIIPVVAYHAVMPFTLYSAFRNIEAVEGTLDLCVMDNSFQHAYNNAAWATRFCIDGETHTFGTGIDRDGNRYQYSTNDPTALIHVSSRGDGEKASVAQLNNPVNLLEMATTRSQQAEMTSASLGDGNADLQRVSSDGHSGFALQIKAESRQEARKKQAPLMRASDRILMSRLAAGSNYWTGSTLPEEGWDIEYMIQSPVEAVDEPGNPDQPDPPQPNPDDEDMNAEGGQEQ